MISMKYIEPPTDNPDHDEFCERADYHDDQRPSNPIGALYDLNSGRETVVEFGGRSLAEILKADRPKTKGCVKRGVADKSFREVSLSGHFESNLVYTVEQSAEFLQLSYDTVLELCKNGELKSTQRKNAYRILGSSVLDLFHKRR